MTCFSFLRDANDGGAGTTTATTNGAEATEAVAAPPIAATTWNADHIRVKIVKDCGDHLQVKIVKESGHDDIEVKIEKKEDGRCGNSRIYDNNNITYNTNTTCMEITISNWINHKKVIDQQKENVYNWTMFCAFYYVVCGSSFSDNFVFVLFFVQVYGLFCWGGMDLLHKRFNNTIITVHSTNGSTRTIISNNSNSNAVVVELVTKNEILVQTAQKKIFCPAPTDRAFHFGNFYQPDKKFSLDDVHEIIAVEHEEFVYAVSILWYFCRSLVPRKNYCVEMIATATTTTTTDDDNDDNAVITKTILVRDLQDMETARYVQNQLDDFLFVQNHQDRYHRYIDADDDDDKDVESNDIFNDEEEEMITMKATTATTEILPLSSANNTTTELLPVFDNRGRDGNHEDYNPREQPGDSAAVAVALKNASRDDQFIKIHIQYTFEKVES
ncbi:hypothetical protein FRACYDRAFT_245111 [Fragilariopsis cylindrus CCMP1102]|uniref:Uncharacterized protein n=1 Tax=Fragilariopsis cylindrus CCMP1102 TaxID=635003 RepID=A0A1E7F1P1_9STRA|nr:hypothetical protein FRACYDRAFT_245111 [Fragilariopsis cylindrus CCMP1102]|eukprot:OEU11985.1 hypothetical protein FRACYDRAFT_245111 [Fragilariopsis cylindrus CCMP1102]